GEENVEELVFSARFACAQCGYSLNELEPRLFSFNNPAGACPSCDGLGQKQFFDADKVIVNPHAGLAAGAIRGWDKRNVYYFQLLQALANHLNFDIDTPFNELSDEVRNAILYGTDKEKVAFRYLNDKGEIAVRHHPFEGVLPNMERRYRETESEAVREDLAKYLSHSTCPSCSGSRLKESARHVFIDDRSLPELVELPIGDAFAYFSALVLPGHKGEIAEKILKEIRDRLEFLVNVGLNYLNLSRNAETLSGGEAQRIRLASQIGAGLVGVMYVLDETSIGLHQRDNQRLLDTLIHLRDLGNTVIVVEHDEDAMRNADFIVDIGPGAGRHGGEVVATGTIEDILANEKSLTGKYLSGIEEIAVPTQRLAPSDQWLTLQGA